MFNKVGTVCVFVADQDRAKNFYVNTLGFALVTDQPLFPGAANRWVSVVPRAGGETELILYLPDENWEHYKQVVGKSQSVTLDVSDIVTLVNNLKAKGVQVTREPDPQPWGTNAMILDSEGNTILLVETPKR
ncbi:MAG: VOC family protein [Anaerolineae bacterium]